MKFKKSKMYSTWMMNEPCSLRRKNDEGREKKFRGRDWREKKGKNSI